MTEREEIERLLNEYAKALIRRTHGTKDEREALLSAIDRVLAERDALLLDKLSLPDKLLAAHTALIHAAHEYRKGDDFDSAQVCSTAALHVRGLRNAALSPEQPHG